MANLTDAFTALQNASLFEAAEKAYTSPQIVGDFFWPIIAAFFLILVYIKTESPAFVGIYSIITAFAMATLLPVFTSPIFYIYLVFAIALTLWSFFASPRIDA